MSPNKKKIVLISPYDEIIANGLRIICAYLRKHGHEVKLIFLNQPKSKFSDAYSKEVYNDLICLCKASDLIGISLMTNYFVKAREITIKIKEKLNIPVIWGGLHPTLKPEECLKYADMACIGEGEEAMLELADKLGTGDIAGIRNIWFKKNAAIIRNEVRPLEENLDKYPFQDYDYTRQYLLKNNRIIEATEQRLEEAMPHSGETGRINVEYQLITTRGCPYNCAYCSNNALREVYQNKGRYVRKRGIENIVQEIELMCKRFNFIRQILITDDTFFVRSEEEIREFSDCYKQRVNLPMRCYISPLEMNEPKLKSLIDAGLFRVSMGIQSYSSETLLGIYKRKTPKKAILESVRIINKYKASLPRPTYHIIIDNPYESKESKKENIEFMLALPQGTRVGLFPLTLFPGTELYERAKKDGLINNEIEEVYLKGWSIDDVKKLDYLTYILYLCKWLKFKDKAPSLPTEEIIKFLIRDKVIFVLDNRVFLSAVFMIRKIIKIESHFSIKVKKRMKQILTKMFPRHPAI